ncbi:MAG: hypothetical protein IPK66_14665 [Rhodospirillales bacterium]|nr:hypothetical protein [Rhodospirillales bacterium]
MIKINAKLPRWPRSVYWILGATISCTGAIGARLISNAFPLNERIPIWLAGAVVVFLGLGVLSFGTRARLADDELPPSPADIERRGDKDLGDQDLKDGSGDPSAAGRDDGAGEGNRTLV